MCGFVVHARPQLLEKKRMALFLLIALNAAMSGLISTGASQWHFIATKDSESFNIVGSVALVSIPENAKTTRWAALHSINDVDFLNPINRLMYFTITNKKQTPSKVIGLSLEISSKSSWLDSWTKMCPVDLSHARIALVVDGGDVLLSAKEDSLDLGLKNKPIEPSASVSGWSGWECLEN